MQIYGLKSCDTCRKAARALPQAELVDVRTNGLPPRVREAALEAFGEALVNTRSTTWRGLSVVEREAPVPEVLARYPALMKRPLILAEGRLYLGWTADVRSALGVV